MKSRFWAVVTVGLVSALLTATNALGHDRVLLTSPDHPRTWWTGNFYPCDHYVQWNAARGVLEGYVTYGDPSYASPFHPLGNENFRVRFPDVRLDAREGTLYVQGPHHRHVVIGRLAAGVFGSRVELASDVSFEAHRYNGHLNAALVAD